ncbi:TPA: helix-turn-helix domain-containing protein [Vibrio vulnificus]
MSRDSLIKAIKHRRRLAGLTQEQLAEKAGISKKTYKRIEQGVRDITWSEYERILEALMSVSLTWCWIDLSLIT